MGFLDTAGTAHFWEKIRAFIAAKQDKLTGTAGQMVGFDTDGAAVAVRGWSNPNLLDNWYFLDPVNQKGKDIYRNDTWKPVYGIDRWVNAVSELDVSAHKVTVTSAYGRIQQNIEDKSLVGKEVTLSVLYSDLSGGSVGVSSVPDDIGLKWSSNPSGLLSSTFIMGAPTYCNMAVIEVRNPGDSVNIIAAKLELGPVQTLAHQDADGNWVLNDPPPDKALELLKCQRYYRIYATQSARPSNALDCNPVMRVNPAQTTITIDGATYYANDANL